MDRVFFEVEDSVAKQWRYTSMEQKEKLSGLVNKMLSSALKKHDDDFWDFMDKMGKQAVANGLTEEKLNKILNED